MNRRGFFGGLFKAVAVVAAGVALPFQKAKGFACRLIRPRLYAFRSETYVCIIEKPSHHLIIENFSGPPHEGTLGEVWHDGESGINWHFVPNEEGAAEWRML